MTMMKTICLLFWYGVDTTETSVRNKTMFGGVKGKFNGLELFREGRGGGGGERWRMEEDWEDKEEEDYFWGDEEEEEAAIAITRVAVGRRGRRARCKGGIATTMIAGGARGTFLT